MAIPVIVMLAAAVTLAALGYWVALTEEDRDE